jgi:hypothetical protein
VPQPYDLTGIATARATIEAMISDQTSGKVKFAGGFATWVPSPVGWFNAITSVGGSLAPTTTNLVRTTIKGVRTTLDLLAGGTGTVSANIVQTDTPPTLLLEVGKLATGPPGVIGPLVNSPASVASTKYDLSGIAALQATVNGMLADQQAGTTVFVGNAAFQAVLTVGGAAQALTINDVVGRYSALQRRFDVLDQ